MSARLALAGADIDEDEWGFAPDELEPVKIESQDDPVFVRRAEVPGLLKNRLFETAWREWLRFKNFGLAHGRGPNGERAIYVKVLQIMEQEFSGFQMTEMRKGNGRR